MAREDGKAGATPRREFLTQISAAAAVSGLALGRTARAEQEKPLAAAPLPTIKPGDPAIRRLVAGWTPLGGKGRSSPRRKAAPRAAPRHSEGENAPPDAPDARLTEVATSLSAISKSSRSGAVSWPVRIAWMVA